MKRLNIVLHESDFENINKLVEARHTTKTEVIRGALATELFLREIYGKGDRLLIQHAGEDAVREIVLVHR